MSDIVFFYRSKPHLNTPKILDFIFFEMSCISYLQFVQMKFSIKIQLT